MFLKLSGLLFPPSDYRHPVTTPAFQIMSHVLSSGRFATRNSIASGLFIATLFVEVSLDFEILAISLVSFVFVNWLRRQIGEMQTQNDHQTCQKSLQV